MLLRNMSDLCRCLIMPENHAHILKHGSCCQVHPPAAAAVPRAGAAHRDGAEPGRRAEEACFVHPALGGAIASEASCLQLLGGSRFCTCGCHVAQRLPRHCESHVCCYWLQLILFASADANMEADVAAQMQRPLAPAQAQRLRKAMLVLCLRPSSCNRICYEMH